MSHEPFIRKLTLHNFRSIRNETVTFANPLFLVGRNGSGKSNFVDALAFLSECIDRPLLSVIMSRGNMVGLCSQIGDGKYASNMAVRIDFELGGEGKQQGHYGFQINAFESSFRVAQEQCVVTDNGKISWFNRLDETFLTNINGFAPIIEPQSLALPIVGGMREFSPAAQSLKAMRVYAIEPSRIRGVHYSDVRISLKRDGSNIASMLQQIEQQHPEVLLRVIELLNAVVPNVIDVRSLSRGEDITLAFLQLSPDNKYMGFADIGISDGTLRTLGLIVAALQEPIPSLIAIEEPELNIHPGALEAIADIIHIAAERTQVVVTTHSPDLIDAKWIAPENLRVVEWEKGATHILELGEAPVQALRQHLMGAGELLRANALDAAPVMAETEDLSDLFDKDLA